MRTSGTIAERSEQQKAEKPQNGHKQKKTGFRGPSPDVGKATQFKPGQPSANPGGRPKQDWSAEIARAVFENNKEAIYQAMLKPLLAGNAYAFKELAERGYGKLRERHEHSGVDGKPIQFEDMTDADLQSRLDQLLGELGLVRSIDEAGRAGIAQAGTGQASGNE